MHQEKYQLFLSGVQLNVLKHQRHSAAAGDLQHEQATVYYQTHSYSDPVKTELIR